MIKEQFFPTTIYAKDVQLDNDLFTREVVRWSNEDKGIKRTNMNGWHSHTDMHKIPVFKPLVDELFKMQFEVFNEEHLDREPIIGNMWANINPPGGYNRPHIHPNSHFSGVYYIKATKDSGDIVLMILDLHHTWLCLLEKKVNHQNICGEKSELILWLVEL